MAKTKKIETPEDNLQMAELHSVVMKKTMIMPEFTFESGRRYEVSEATYMMLIKFNAIRN